MITALATPEHKQAFAGLIEAWPALRADMGCDLLLWADNPGAPVKLFLLTEEGSGLPTAALTLNGDTAILCGKPDVGAQAELVSFLGFVGVQKLRTHGPLALPGWKPAGPLFCYCWPQQGIPRPLLQGYTIDKAPPMAEVAELLFPNRPARQDAFYVTANAARNHGLAHTWLLRGPHDEALSTVTAGALYAGEAYLEMGYTMPTARHKGLYGPLITALAAALTAEGYHVTFLCAAPLCPLYERLGFTQIEKYRQYYTNCI